ncbi:MAG: class I SAM-dependent methyltransferase [Candidatus Abyssobacteria bacterium SURF_17]|jgi:SAM-dependent methyltransferase|uniref:Class I SAM-dependent methyltransferase n=1 Tax=Candidatus Abyssobacteria bacterium SURF_17 TaxID=2093361 RepID=A0A419EY18_9BACT|nr:MAG: class I SAM-dependent methyltransferase [Candidatus Abyssubacteria bacterium SURF_17]
MSWDKEYDRSGHLWGEGPSELGMAAVSYFQTHALSARTPEIVDIGCGYGRDTFYLLETIPCKITGIDTSEKAIEIARSESLKRQNKDVEFQRRDFGVMNRERFDIVFASNLYQLLKKKEREEFRNMAERILKPGGLLFLSTLSVSDPEHSGQGVPVPNDPNSYDIGKFLHFCTKEELARDFSFLEIRQLYEHEYDEPRATGETHHHISWILIGERIRKESA